MMETMEVVVKELAFRWKLELTAPVIFITVLMKTTC